MTSDFNRNPKNKAISFGISREAYSKVYCKENLGAARAVPGPGTYAQGVVMDGTAKFSMRPKPVHHSKDFI